MSFTTRFVAFIILIVDASGLDQRPDPSLPIPVSDNQTKACKLSDINVQRNFNLKRFVGLWYDIARVELTRDAVVLSSAVSNYSLQANGELRIEYGGEVDGRCIRPLVATGKQNFTSGAKFIVNFQDLPNGFLRGAFWIIETNYEYAVIYGCFKRRSDGTCETDEELAYVISRKPKLPTSPPNLFNRIEFIIRQRLCINVTRLKMTQHNLTCPPDPQYDPKSYWDEIIAARDEDSDLEDTVNANDSFAVTERLLIDSNDSSSSTGSTIDIGDTVALHYYENVTTEPVSAASDEDLSSVAITEDVIVATTTDMDSSHSDEIAGISDDTSEKELDGDVNAPATFVYDFTTPFHESDVDDNDTSDKALSESCHVDDIPTHEGFDVDKFFGKWFLILTYSSSSMLINSGAAFLTRDHGNVIKSVFAGYSTIFGCLPKFYGFIRYEPTNQASMFANYGSHQGPMKIVYINDNYTGALIYQCDMANSINGSCVTVTVDVVSRTREMTSNDLNDIMRHVDDVCLASSDFMLVKQETECFVEEEKQESICKLENFKTVEKMDWSMFDGMWYSVARFKGRLGFESGTWAISFSDNGNISVTYVASRYGYCLAPVHVSWFPAVDGSGNLRAFYNGGSAIGKIVYIDHQVAIYYGCRRLESDGTCRRSNVHLDIMQREKEIEGNLLLTHGQLIQDLCIETNKLKLVSHNVTCHVPPRCVVPSSLNFQDDSRVNKLMEGRWKNIKRFDCMDSNGKLSLNEMIFTTVDNKGKMVACITSTDSQNVCRKTECLPLDSLFIGRLNLLNDEKKHSAVFRLVYVTEETLILYVCDELDKNGRGVCQCPGVHLFVFGRGQGQGQGQGQQSIEEDVLKTLGLEITCVDWKKVVNTTVDCHVEIPPYSKVIDYLPSVTGIRLSELMGIWYSAELAGDETSGRVSKLRLSLETSGKMDIVIAANINGTCQASRRYLATMKDKDGTDWTILTADRTSGHIRIIYTDYYDIAVIYYCRRLRYARICSPNQSFIHLLSRLPVLNDDRLASALSNLRTEGYDGVDDVVRKAGFQSLHSGNYSFIGAVACPMHVDEDLCPIESLPVLKKLHFNKFLGTWYVVSRLKNSPSFDSAELRLSPGEETTIVYTGTKDGRCQRPLRGKLSLLSDDVESQFEIRYGDEENVGRFQVIYTNYRAALVYQCLQLLADGACLPGQVKVELLSRTKTMDERLKSPLITRTQDLCVDRNDMIDSKHEIDCNDETESSCYVDYFPKDVTFVTHDFFGTWHVSFVAINDEASFSVVKILSNENNNRSQLTVQLIGGSDCQNVEERQLILSPDLPHQMILDFPENNILWRVIEASSDMILLYTCKFLESDGRCRQDRSNVLILARTTNSSLSEESLAHYTDVSSELCHGSDELIRINISDCESRKEILSENDDDECDVLSVHSEITQQQLYGEWHLAGLLVGNSELTAIKYEISRSTNPGNLVIHFTGERNGRCLPTTKLSTKSTGDSSFDVAINDKHVELIVLYVDDNISVIYHCQEEDSVGGCAPSQLLIEVFTRDVSLPDLAKNRLLEVGESLCLNLDNFIPFAETDECPLLIEPECSVHLPAMRTNLDLDKIDGRWFALATSKNEKKDDDEINSIEIQLFDDQNQMKTIMALSRSGRCLTRIQTIFFKETQDNFKWTFHFNGLNGYILLVHVDDDLLVLLECLSNETCSADSASHIDVYVRSRKFSENKEVVNKTLSTVLRRICQDIDNFDFLQNDEVVCDIYESLSCQLQSSRRQRTDFVIQLMTGTWYVSAKTKHSEVMETQMIKITGAESFAVTYFGSRRGQCASIIGEITEVNDGNIEMTFNHSSTSMSVLFTDYRYLVALKCQSDVGGNSSCEKDGDRTIAIYTREPGDISSIIPELIRVAGLDDCVDANDFVFVSNEDSCHMTSSPNCISQAIHVPYENFTKDDLIGSWFSIYRLRSRHSVDSYVIRFHKDGATGNIVVFFTFVRRGVCQTAVNFTISSADVSGQWNVTVMDKNIRLKVISINHDHMILYHCLHYDVTHDRCHPDMTYVTVLSRDSVVELDNTSFVWAANALHELCRELGDMERTVISSDCRLPIIKKTGCLMDKTPVTDEIDYNKFAGVWYSYYLLKSPAQLDFSTVILQPSLDNSFLAIFRSSRRDECLSAQTATVKSRGIRDSTGDFYAQFKIYKARWRVLYTDYNYALIYECTDESLTDGQCPSVHRQAVIYGRAKTGQLPQNAREKIFAAANEACLYEDDFVQAIHFADCDLPYSGRHSCHLNHVVTHDSFDIRDMFGNWQLLSRTTSVNASLAAESYRVSLGVGGMIKYSLSGEDGRGVCRSHEGTIESIANQNATFKFIEKQQGTTDLVKILFMNSQYLIFYVCRGHDTWHVNEDVVACDADNEQVTIYGRTSVMTTNVRKMLTDIVWPRTCVRLDVLVDVKFNNKCDLPAGCDIQDFIIQENFDPKLIRGTWQALVRSTFRQSSTFPTTAKFSLTSTKDALKIVKVISHSDSKCKTETLMMRPAEGTVGFYQMEHVGQHATSTSMVLYVVDRYFVTLDCIGGLSSEGECTAEKVELTVWGRTWDLDGARQRVIIQEIRDRTLRCYAVNTMIEVMPNYNCEFPERVCDMNEFELEQDFDGRLILGQWHILSRSPTYKSLIRTGDSRISLSGDMYHLRIAGRDEKDDCFETSGFMRLFPGTNSTFLLTVDGINTLTRIVYWSDEYLIRLDCVGVHSLISFCPHERTGLQILSRTGYIDEDTTIHLIEAIRQRTHSCIATRSLEILTFSHNTCPNTAPSEGIEECGFDDIRLGYELNLQQVNGTWFQVMRSNRVNEFRWDNGILHINVKNRISASLIFAGHTRSRKSDCFIESSEAEISVLDNTEWQMVTHGHNSTLKVIYISDNHLVTYECYKNQLNKHAHCIADNEHVEVFHRRRYINSHEEKQLLNIVSQRTCFSRTEIVRVNNTAKCEVPGIIELNHFKNKACDVNSYPVVSNFQTDKFSGIWYEVERTRYSNGRTWESGIFNFSVDPVDGMSFLYSGSNDGRCMGPIEAHSQQIQDFIHLDSSDLIMSIGSKFKRDHPWTVNFRFKIISTDYENTAFIYSCYSTSDDGKCHTTSEQVYILSRRPVIDAVTRETMYRVVVETACIDVHDLVQPVYEANCQKFVDGAYAEVEEMMREKHLHQTRNYFQEEEISNKIDEEMKEKEFETVSPQNFENNVADEFPCPIPMCANFCPNGYALDERGCESCNCRPDDEATTTTEASPNFAHTEATLEGPTKEAGLAQPAMMEWWMTTVSEPLAKEEEEEDEAPLLNGMDDEEGIHEVETMVEEIIIPDHPLSMQDMRWARHASDDHVNDPKIGFILQKETLEDPTNDTSENPESETQKNSESVSESETQKNAESDGTFSESETQKNQESNTLKNPESDAVHVPENGTLRDPESSKSDDGMENSERRDLQHEENNATLHKSINLTLNQLILSSSPPQSTTIGAIEEKISTRKEEEMTPTEDSEESDESEEDDKGLTNRPL